MIVTQMCYKERKSRGGRRGGASEVRSAGTTLSSSPGSARSRRHKQSLKPMESMAHKKTLKYPMFSMSGVSGLSQSQCSGSEVKREQSFLFHMTGTRQHKPPISFWHLRVSERISSPETKKLTERKSRNPRRFKIAHASYLLPIWPAAQEAIRYQTFCYVINFSVTLLQKSMKKDFLRETW